MGRPRIPKEQKQIEAYKTGVCPYSDDCFICPEKDCIANGAFAYKINVLQSDVERGNAANPKLSLVYMKNRSGVVIVGFVTTLLLRGRSCRAASVVDVQVRG